MDLLVAYGSDPAGSNMARHLAKGLPIRDGIYRGDRYHIAILDTPTVEADWLESRFQYDGYVFLSKHSAASGQLALTCHTTGNFGDEVRLGGSPRQVAVPYASLLKSYIRALWSARDSFGGFDITLETTHHGPTALHTRSLFVEVGTTPEQWNDTRLCGMVADVLDGVLGEPGGAPPEAICFGGTHYPKKFTSEAVSGKYAPGTIVPKSDMGVVDERTFSHILERNASASVALLDWSGMGPHRRRILDMLEKTDLEVVRL